MQCAYCGAVVPQPFKCAYCGEYYCGEHRIPETHRCVVSRRVMNVPGKASARETGRWPGRQNGRAPAQPSVPYKRRRRWGYRPSAYHRWLRIRKSYVFLLMWVAGFALGLYLVPALNYLALIGISLFNTIVISIFVFGIAGIAHRGVGHKAFGVLLIIVLAGFLYQNPAVLANINAPSVSNLYVQEASYISSVPSNLESVASNLGPPAINAQWVHEFFGNLSATREANGAGPLTETQQLDNFASLRFNDLVAHYQITHYGYDQDFTSYFGAYGGVAGTEEYFYPSGHTPSDFVSYLQQSAPAHYQGLIDGTYSHYGFYIGSGPVYNIYGSCPATEIVGSVNQTQFFEQNGCNFSVGQTIWLVVELTS